MKNKSKWLWRTELAALHSSRPVLPHHRTHNIASIGLGHKTFVCPYTKDDIESKWSLMALIIGDLKIQYAEYDGLVTLPAPSIHSKLLHAPLERGAVLPSGGGGQDSPSLDDRISSSPLLHDTNRYQLKDKHQHSVANIWLTFISVVALSL